MKASRVALAVASLNCWLAVRAVAAAGIVNGCFEDGLSGWQVAGDVSVELAAPLEGKRSVRLGPGPGVMWQRYAVKGEKHLWIQALIKAEPLAAGRFDIRMLDAHGRELMALRSDTDLKLDPKKPLNRGYYLRTHPLTAAIEVVIANRSQGGSVVADQVILVDKESDSPPPAPTCSLKEYLQPFWQGKTVHNETVLMLSEGGQPATGRLMFNPTRIISVRDFSLRTNYVENVDYTLVGRVLTCTPASRMTRVKDSEFEKGELKWYGVGDKPVVVTYEHNDAWPGPTPHYGGDQMPNTIQRLKAHAPLTVVAYGDSITFGINVSRVLDQPPFMPTWAELLVHRLKNIYAYNGIRLYNSAQSGSTSEWGSRLASRRVASLDPDLVIIAFGMNDFWGTSAQEFKAHIAGIIAAVRARKPAAEFLLVSSLRFDPTYSAKAEYSDRLTQYRDELAGLCGTGVQMLDMTAISEALYAAKKPKDCITDPMHPNDFLARWYAQGLAALLDPACAGASTTPPLVPASGKKGVGQISEGMPEVSGALGCSWYYNWKARPFRTDGDVRAEFVPMIWNGAYLDTRLAGAKATGATTLLGFNEPDNKEQANMSVANAVELWPRLMATGMRLGSPATTTTGDRWLGAFMREVKRKGLRVDFLCLHWYGDITRSNALEALRTYLQDHWERYRLPIWLTEYSGADFVWHRRKVTVQDNAAFAQDSKALLDSLPYVERYAWFGSECEPQSKHYSSVGLYDPVRRTLTPVGLAYRGQAPSTSPKVIHLLTVGNSLSQNATHYLGDLAKAGGDTLILHEADVGGASLELHWTKAQAFEKDPADKQGRYPTGKSLREELQSEPWDFVTIQQASVLSHDVATYRPFAQQLSDYIHHYAPGAALLVHQTWEYRVDDGRFAATQSKPGEPRTQDDMYHGLADAYGTIARELRAQGLPVGDAFHLANHDPVWGFHPPAKVFDAASAKPGELPDQTHSLNIGWDWKPGSNAVAQASMDGVHANEAGEYLGSCVWYEVLFGRSSEDVTFVPPGLDADYAKFLRATAHRAVQEACR
jgi:lysophospholipase L1-like esterase